MRQVNYKYRSYMNNYHGFVNMIPDARFFHPLIGFSGEYGLPTFHNLSSPMYSSLFCDMFRDKVFEFEHKVKIFFPEIRNGAIYVDTIKYSISQSNYEDTVNMSYDILHDGKYQEYVEVKNFISEFTVLIKVDFGKRISITEPVEIDCDYIDIRVMDQLISLTIHDNNILFVPYLISFRDTMPPEIARNVKKVSLVAENANMSYGFVVNNGAKDALEKRGMTSNEIDVSLLNIRAKRDTVLSAIQRGALVEEVLPITSSSSGLVSNKYVVTLPRVLFRDRMELRGFPIFDSEKNMSCCEIIKKGMCSPYFSMYGIKEIPDSCKPGPCECEEKPRYEVRNIVLDGYLILAENSLDELNSMVPEFLSEHPKQDDSNIDYGE